MHAWASMASMAPKDALPPCKDISSAASLSGSHSGPGSGTVDALPAQASTSDAMEAQLDAGQASQEAVLMRLECMTARELKVVWLSHVP